MWHKSPKVTHSSAAATNRDPGNTSVSHFSFHPQIHKTQEKGSSGWARSLKASGPWALGWPFFMEFYSILRKWFTKVCKRLCSTAVLPNPFLINVFCQYPVWICPKDAIHSPIYSLSGITALGDTRVMGLNALSPSRTIWDCLSRGCWWPLMTLRALGSRSWVHHSVLAVWQFLLFSVLSGL